PNTPGGFTFNGFPGGTTVMLNEYACAIDGTGQRELGDCMANVRVALPIRLGGPKPAGYVPSRASAMRHGVIATNTSEPTGVAAKDVASLENALTVSGFAAAWLSARVGCQYSGAGHGDSGTMSRCTWPIKATGIERKRIPTMMEAQMDRLAKVPPYR